MGEYSKSSKLERSRHTILQKTVNAFVYKLRINSEFSRKKLVNKSLKYLNFHEHNIFFCNFRQKQLLDKTINYRTVCKKILKKLKEKVWMKNRCSPALLKIPIWSWLLSWMPNWTGRDYFWKRSWRHGWRFSMMSPSTLKSSNSCQYWNFLKDGNLGIFFCLIYQKHGTGERKIGLNGICTGKKYANF